MNWGVNSRPHRDWWLTAGVRYYDFDNRTPHFAVPNFVRVLANSPVSPSEFGHIWHQLDRELALPTSILDIQYLGDYDLRRYNVLVIPDVEGGIGALLKANAERLTTWVRGGGTLIAIGSAAAGVAQAEPRMPSRLPCRRAPRIPCGSWKTTALRRCASASSTSRRRRPTSPTRKT